MAKTRTELLPLNGSTLANDPRLLEKVHAIGARHGVDYTDDAAVTALLTERRRTLERIQRGPLAWLGALILTAAVLWPFLAPEVPGLADNPVLSYAPAGPLLLVSVACLALVHVRVAVWLAGSRQGAEKQRLRAEAEAYVEAVATARAAGARVPEPSPALRELLDQ